MNAALPLLLCLGTGCASMQSGDFFTPPWKKSAKKKDMLPKDTYLHNERAIEREPLAPEVRAELDEARQLFADKKYAEAEKRFSKLAAPESSGFLGIFDSGGTDFASGGKYRAKHPRSVCEEAMFHEAECQREQTNYRDAHNTYTKLLHNFPRSQYTQGACRGLFQIADHWLVPTRKQMDEYQAQVKGERWFVTPAMYFHFSKDMPSLDAEGNALQILNTVFLHDINGSLGEKALLWLGTINFFRKDYKEADFYFSKLFQEHPNGEHAATALKQSVICKQLSTGGSVYDCRGVEESKKLLMTGQAAYKELSKEDKWVETQLKSINAQQADRDYKIAEFYRRTGHPGSAYFYYELVRRRYSPSSYADSATAKMNEIRAEVEREQGRNATDGPAPPVETPPQRPNVDPQVQPAADAAAPPRPLMVPAPR